MLKLLILSITSFGFGQGIFLESNITNDLFDVCFYDSLKGWAVGDSATIIMTNDGGITWTRQFAPAADSTEFTNVEFVNSYSGFVGGNRISRIPGELIYYPIILKTTDGGENWKECDLGLSQMPEYTDISFYDMDFLDSNTGWVAVNETKRRVGMLLGTENGGENWNLVRKMSADLIFTVTIWDNNLGYIFYGPSFDNFDVSTGAYTENSGATWTSSGTIFSFYMNDLVFISPDTLWSIGTQTYKSHDRGINWVNIYPTLSDQDFGNPSDIHAFNSQNVLLLGRAKATTDWRDYSSVLMTTKDGGRNWNQLLAIPQTDLNAIHVFSPHHIWIVGEKGLIIFVNISEITSVEKTDIDRFSFKLKQNYPNPFNPSTTIKYNLKKTSRVQLNIYNLAGQKIETLINKIQTAGDHEITWQPKGLPSGIFFYRLQAGDYSETKKLILQK